MTGIYGIWIFELLWCLSNLIMNPRKLPYEKGLKREAACGKFDEAAYNKMKKKQFTIHSNFGYSIACELLEPGDTKENGGSVSLDEDNAKPKIAILCHGLGFAKFCCVKYCGMYFNMGYKVVIYDHRNHGMSGKANTSMGFYERYDLKSVVDWCYETYGGDCIVVTHGESMGAATVIMHLGIDDRVKCAVADCAYSDLEELIKHQLHEYYHLPYFLIPIESCFTYLRAGFWYRDISPIKVVCQVNTPILFIHGKIDNLVPAEMSKHMYACKKDKKGIYLVSGAKHAESYCVNKEGYSKRVGEFLNKYLKDS